MLALKNRFHGHNSLRPLYQKGQSVYSANLKLLHAPARGKQYRVAVVVSKKVHKSAVVRNRIRRRIYELVRHIMQDAREPHDLIFVVQNQAPQTVPYDILQNELNQLLKKVPNML